MNHWQQRLKSYQRDGQGEGAGIFVVETKEGDKDKRQEGDPKNEDPLGSLNTVAFSKLGKAGRTCRSHGFAST